MVLKHIADGEFKWDPEGGKRPDEVKSGADVVAWYEPAFAKAMARVEGCSPEHLATEVQFAMWKKPLIETLGFAISHSIHHRGQLSAYLRPMGSKVPGIYGPSADEPMDTSSGASA